LLLPALNQASAGPDRNTLRVINDLRDGRVKLVAAYVVTGEAYVTGGLPYVARRSRDFESL